MEKKGLVGFTGIFNFQNFSQVKMDNLQIIDFMMLQKIKN